MRRTIAYISFLLLLAYLCWEVYWYSRVGLTFIHWHTHLILYVYLGAAVYLSSVRSGTASVPMGRVPLTAMSLISILFILESVLLISGRYATYVERREGSYVSPYGNPNTLHYNTYPPHHQHLLHASEYSYTRMVNALGFADVEWTVDKRSGHKRILALGDSFTEGDGAPYDSSYVALMRRYAGEDWEMMNAGTCGSDPVNNYMNLADRLLAYHPDIVVQSLSSGDLNADILLRGGLERVHGTHAPWWEPLYAVSCVSRAFFRAAGYNELLRKSEMTAEERAKVDSTMIDLLTRYSELCRRHDMKLFVVAHPYRSEVERGNYDYDLSPLCEIFRADTTIHFIDLLPAYQAYIAHTHTTAGDYFWSQDGHHNSRGYDMMAATTWQYIQPYLSDTTAH